LKKIGIGAFQYCESLRKINLSQKQIRAIIDGEVLEL